MLAQIEDFQKKLWLKKKFVVQTDWCITLDRVPRELYAEVIANDRQREEWVRLFAIDEIKDDVLHVGYSAPLTERFLEENQFLVLDTAFFSEEFKRKLVSKMEDIDEECNGLLINSENFQALELLQEKYTSQIGFGYFDPPYNTSDNGFAYKNNYRHSSWCSMIAGRTFLTKKLLAQNGTLGLAIDDFEAPYLSNLLDDIYGFGNRLGNLVIEIKPSGRTNDFYLATSHEYLLLYAKNHDDVSINFSPLSEEQQKLYKETSSSGEAVKWRDFLRTGGYSTPEERPNSYYPVYYNPITNDISLEKNDENSVTIWPIDSTGKKRVWRKTPPSFQHHLNNNEIKVAKNAQGEYKIKIIDKIKEGLRPKSVWTGSRYDASSHGTKLIKNIIPDNSFSFPKSLDNVCDAIYMAADSDDVILDIFAGSGTTGHAVIKLNREDENESNRKYILCEMAEYFKTVTKPRIEKVIYSSDWKDGKPVSRDGISQCFKYVRLEQYEDTLNNLVVNKPADIFSDEGNDSFKESYMLGYMMDTETRGSLFNIEWFRKPFDMTIKTTKNNELVETKVDMVETFNYLIGLNVETEHWHNQGAICAVEGTLHRTGEKALVIWRDCEKVDNEALNTFFRKMDYNTLASEFDVIYVNGDNTLPNVRKDDEHWKVILTEEEFRNRMFEEN